MSGGSAKLVGHILYAENSNGAKLYWGVCSHCAMVEELSERRCEEWQRVGCCDVCLEEVAEEERAQEASYYRMMSSWRGAVFPAKTPPEGET